MSKSRRSPNLVENASALTLACVAAAWLPVSYFRRGTQMRQTERTALCVHCRAGRLYVWFRDEWNIVTWEMRRPEQSSVNLNDDLTRSTPRQRAAASKILISLALDLLTAKLRRRLL